MTKSQHTPGPWSTGNKQIITCKTGLNDNYVIASSLQGPDKEANARLIAVAPDGLELAERVIDYFSGASGIDAARKELEELKLDCDLEILDMAVAMQDKATGT